jgi:hypothetical protein
MLADRVDSVEGYASKAMVSATKDMDCEGFRIDVHVKNCCVSTQWV